MSAGGVRSGRFHTNIVARPQGIVARPQGIVARPQGIVARPQGIVARPQGIVARLVDTSVLERIGQPAVRQVVEPLAARGELLSQPDAAFESWLAEESLIFEKKFQEEHPTTMGDPSVGIMGTGAFEVDSWDPTTGIQLSANPHWWGGPVRVEHVSVKFFANETSEALAFGAGEVNVAFPADSSFGSTAGVKVDWVPSDYEGMFSMNVQVAPWDNIYVRRAVAYALDRADLVKALGIPGQAVTTLIPPDQLGLLGSRAQVNALISSLPSYPCNLAKAKAELALSPYPHGFTAPTNTLEHGTYTPETEVIAAELAKIGINLNIKEQSFTQWISTAVARRHTGTFTLPGTRVFQTQARSRPSHSAARTSRRERATRPIMSRRK